MSGTARPSVAARFGWGVALPAAALFSFVILVTVTGRGREWGPAVALVYGIASIPGAMLANAWLLFVGWPRARLLLAGLAIPAYVAIALAILAQGSRGDDNAGARMLAPFLALLESRGSVGMAGLFGVWLAALAAVIAAAAWRERRRS